MGSQLQQVIGPQIRAARALLGMTAVELATQTGLALNTIRRAEASDGVPNITPANLNAILTTLEEAGVCFIGSDAEGEGVRFQSKRG